MRRTSHFPVGLLAVLAISSSTSAVGQTLVRDINLSPGYDNPDSTPSQLVASSGFVVYRAETLGEGVEPWRSDGTEAGTIRLADVKPGAAGSDPDRFTAIAGGRVVFTADDGTHGAELWVTDGLAGGTSLVRDIFPGAASSGIHALAAFQGKAYFFADDGVAGAELWVSDGTASGTFTLVELVPGSGGSSDGAAEAVAAGPALFFSALIGGAWELWTTDGTPAQTAPVKVVAPSPSTPVVELAAFGNRVVFAANDGVVGAEPWVSDGTAAGTYRLGDLNPGASGSTPREFTLHGGLAFFNADGGPAIQRELFKTDGTPAGTVLVRDIFTPSIFLPLLGPSYLTSFAGRLYFQATTYAGGSELWASDGTTAGTNLFVDLVPGTGSSFPEHLFAHGGRLYFSAEGNTTFGQELFSTDGTPAGTGMVTNVFTGSAGSYPSGFVGLGGSVLFQADSFPAGKELWRSDGTAAGTALVADANPALDTLHSDPDDLVAFGGRLFFEADDGVHGRELWVSDGTEAGTQLFLELTAGPSGSYPANPTALSGGFFFSASDPATGAEPRFSDGTVAGSFLLMDIQPGPATSIPTGAVRLGELVLFTATAPGFGRELWRTDGTTAGTTLVGDLLPGVAGSEPMGMSVAGEYAWFTAMNPSTGRELWRTDGTAAGTVQVSDIRVGPTSTFNGYVDVIEHQGFFYFGADDGVTGLEPWRTDGTFAGTAQIADVWPGPTSSTSYGFASTAGGVVFVADDASTNDQLWRTDGTAAGTAMFLNLGVTASVVGRLHESGDSAYVRIDSSVSGTLIGLTDGTPGGTFVVDTIDPSPGASFSSYEWSDVGSGPHVMFGARDGVSGIEPWVVDGTAAGTFHVADVAPGPAHSHAAEFVRAGEFVFFRADDGTTGRELHAIPLVDVGGRLAEPYGDGCPGTGGLVPTVSIGGAATASVPFTFELGDMLPNATALVLIGSVPGALPMDGGCTLLVAPPFLTAAVPTGPLGALQIPVTPAAAWVGVHLYVQNITLDPQGAHLGQAAFSRGLDLLFGP